MVAERSRHRRPVSWPYMTEGSVERLPRGPHNLTREEVTSSQRRRLFEAALNAAAADGYKSISVATLIAGAGVSRRTFYQLFSSKDDCIAEGFDAIFFRVDAQLTAAIGHSSARDWRELVSTSLHEYLSILTASPDLARVLHVEALVAGPPVYPFRARMVSRFVDRMYTAQCLGWAQAGYAEPPQSSADARFLVGGIDDFIRTALIASDFRPSDIRDLNEPITRLALRILEPPPGTAFR